MSAVCYWDSLAIQSEPLLAGSVAPVPLAQASPQAVGTQLLHVVRQLLARRHEDNGTRDGGLTC